MFDFQNNRRTQPRAPVQLPTHVAVQGRELDTRLLLIGEGGCFVAMSPAPPAATRMTLSFDLPGKGPHTATVEVRYAGEIREHGHGRDIVGVGCRFTVVSTTTKQAINELIFQLKKTYSQLQFALAITRPDPHLPQLLK